MSDNVEKYGIELELLTSKFKSELKAIQNITKSVKPVEIEVGTKEIEKSTTRIKKAIKTAFDPEDTSGLLINGKKVIQGISKEFDSLKGKKIDLGNMIEMSVFKRKMSEARANMLQTAQPTSPVSTVKPFQYDTTEIQAKIGETVQSTNRMKDALVEYYAVGGRSEQFESKLMSIQAKMDSTKAKTEMLAKAFGNVKGAIATIGSIGGRALVQGISMPAKTSLKVLGKLGEGVKSIFSAPAGGIKQLLKYAMALFSLRSIYSMLSQSAREWLSGTSQTAQQLSANIQYMKYAIGSALAPVMEYMVNLAYQLLKAIQSAVYALTGFNIFANASASSMKKTAKHAKEAKKNLAGIDELTNIDSKSGSGGGAGDVAPSIDLRDVEMSTSGLIEAIKKEIGMV